MIDQKYLIGAQSIRHYVSRNGWYLEKLSYFHIYVKIQRKISSIYGIDFIFNLIFLLFITQKAVKAQIIVKISEKMLPSSEKIIS